MRSFLCGVFLPALAGAIAAQVPSLVRLPLDPAAPSAIVWDSNHGRLTAVDSSLGVWHWDGAGWRPVLGIPPSPGALPSDAGVAYDSARGRIVVLSQYRVHEWDGATWTSAPSPYRFYTCAFDSGMQRVIATDGETVVAWDGNSWTTLGSNGPAGFRRGFAFAYDPIGARCILYGGDRIPASNGTAECWAFDGAQWTQLQVAAAPGVRFGAALEFEPATGRMILYGGESGATTWALTGSNWSSVATANDPGERANLRFAHDGFGIVVRGGDPVLGSSMWRFQANAWRRIDDGSLPRRYHARVAYDEQRAEIVVHSGFRSYTSSPFFEDTWTFDGRWHLRRTSGGPGPAWGTPATAWSSAEQMVLVFNGPGSTWNWTGSDWVDRTPANSPPWRQRPAMATDPAGGVMLFGGLLNGAYLGDQWHWNGSNWQQMTPAVQPAPRAEAIAGFDPLRGVLVLASGYGSPTNGLTDTWEWDGVQWTQHAATPFVISYSLAQTMTFRPDTGRLFVNGDPDYEWDGSQWTALASASGNLSPSETRHADSRFGRMLAVSELGTRVFTSIPGGATSYGAGCANGPAPALLAHGRPGRGTVVTLATTAFAANVPVLTAIGATSIATPIGAGCQAHVSDFYALFVTTTTPAGEASVALSIPSSAAVLGAGLSAQSVVVDPAHGSFGPLTLSQGLRVAIGD
ncbi:MAG: hypothetical protein KDE27_24340 [Planctomycetes bacterium]|nr:hypothetical protein [Planctomycetota bacterium]